MRYTHQITGRTFTAAGQGEIPTSVAGTWDSGEAGVIYPAETFRDGGPVWVADQEQPRPLLEVLAEHVAEVTSRRIAQAQA